MSASRSPTGQPPSAPGNPEVGEVDRLLGENEAQQREVEPLEDEGEPPLNIGTLMRYTLNLDEEESPRIPQQVVLGPDIRGDLHGHMSAWETMVNDLQLVTVASTSGVSMPTCHVSPPTTPSSPIPTFRTLHRSVQNLVGAAGYRHVLNPNVTWDTLVAETEGRQISREDKARGFVCFVKPTYSSYVDLLDLSLSNSTPSATSLQDSTHSSQDADPLAELINELDLEHVQWEEVQIDPIVNDNLVFLTPETYPTPRTPEDVIIQIPEQPDIAVPQHHEIQVPHDDQILINAGIPRLIDNPHYIWWVSDPPNDSDQSIQSTHSDREDQENSSSSSSIIRDVAPVEIRTEHDIRKYLDFRPKRRDPIDYNNM